MNLSEILERIEHHMLHENYDAVERWRDHLNDMIRWQRHRAKVHHGCDRQEHCYRHPAEVAA